MMKLITIDCGTSFIKATLMEDRTGNILKRISKNTDTIKKTIHMIREVIEDFKYADSEFDVAISTEMHGYILVNNDRIPLCNYVSWKDEWALQLCECGNENYVDKIEAIVGKELFTVSGMKLKPGIASTNLYVMLNRDRSLIRDGVNFLTLGDYIIYHLTNIIPHIHPTNAAASGLYDLRRENWNWRLIEKLGFDFLNFPKVAEGKVVDAEIDGCKYHFYEAVGDQQAALLGAGLNDFNSVSYNLGTGSQVSVLNGELTFNTDNYQTRPFFFGKYLNTIPHVPCGRALNVFVNFCRDIIYRYTNEEVDTDKLWATLTEIALFSDSNELKVDMSFFDNSVSDNTKGYIKNISENNFLPGNLMKAAFECMAENYYIVTERLVPDVSKIDKVIFSGGVANKNLLLREKIAECFNGCDVSVANNETFYGLWKYVNGVKDGTIQ